MKKATIILILLFYSLIFLDANLSGIQARINKIDDNYQKDKITRQDKNFMKFLYNSMIFFGGIKYPEASKILKHYIYGDGSDLFIKSNYFRDSTFIRSYVKKYKGSAIGPIRLQIGTDPRVAYAVNGFYLKKEGQRFIIYQDIVFDTRESGKNVYTRFTVLKNTITIPDYLIRIFESDGGCKSFTANIYWNEKSK